jgi:spore cortex biosynthesis protein YabQ
MSSLGLQVYAFLVMVLTGVAVGVCFDLYRSVRGVVRPRRPVARDLGDLAFSLVAFLLVAAGLFLSNWGELRLYAFAGLAAGAALYFELASETVLAVARGVLILAGRGLRRGGRLAFRAATWPWRTAQRLAASVLRRTRRLWRPPLTWCRHNLRRLRERVVRWLRHIPGFL